MSEHTPRADKWDTPADRSKANRISVVVGTIVTAAFTGLFFVLPVVVPVDDLRLLYWERTGRYVYGNPLLNLRLFGGVVGGVVAGALTVGGWDDGVTNGLRAAVYGLIVLFVCFVSYSLVDATLVEGIVPPPIYLIIVVPVIYSLPILVAHVFGGLVGGYLGSLL